ncbi:MAG: hypothetical protein CL968_04555 [Euryarchaeota archaeon]|nr:hypothetical protein [Euryarchaeota archaeon]
MKIRDLPKSPVDAKRLRQDRSERFSKVARVFAESIKRNSPLDEAGSNCPILVEGKRDREALRNIGFKGTIELLNRGWDQSRLIAYLYDTYGSRNPVDEGPSIIVLMDWDRTGGRLQSMIRKRLESLDMKIDESLWFSLMRAMKPEGRTVEALNAHTDALLPLIQEHM